MNDIIRGVFSGTPSSTGLRFGWQPGAPHKAKRDRCMTALEVIGQVCGLGKPSAFQTGWTPGLQPMVRRRVCNHVGGFLRGQAEEIDRPAALHAAITLRSADSSAWP